ncbi:30S ribosomal protein S13 [Candidatus Woesearchaeota archaeon]|nr:30S ribosomal protein S13 [Candidatus Woesearchaeota archaeon]
MAENKDFNPLVRVVNVDLDGNKAFYFALTKIPGVSYTFANAICKISGIDRNFKTGYLKEAEIKKIEKILEDPIGSGIPVWMLNRRKDPGEGTDRHILTGDIKFIKTNDIRNMQKIKSYKGLRHQWGLPVRGQRTRGNFRKGSAIGVKRKATAKKGRT